MQASPGDPRLPFGWIELQLVSFCDAAKPTRCSAVPADSVPTTLRTGLADAASAVPMSGTGHIGASCDHRQYKLFGAHVSRSRMRRTREALDCRRKLRQTVWDDKTIEENQAEMARLEQALRAIDE